MTRDIETLVRKKGRHILVIGSWGQVNPLRGMEGARVHIRWKSGRQKWEFLGTTNYEGFISYGGESIINVPHLDSKSLF